MSLALAQREVEVPVEQGEGRRDGPVRPGFSSLIVLPSFLAEYLTSLHSVFRSEADKVFFTGSRRNSLHTFFFLRGPLCSLWGLNPQMESCLLYRLSRPGAPRRNTFGRRAGTGNSCQWVVYN